MHSPYWKHLREIADGLRIYQPWIKGGSLPLRLSTQLFNSPCIHMYSIYSCSSYLSWMSLQTQLLGYLLFNKCERSSCFSRLSFIFQSHLGASCQSWLPSCTKILLMVCTRRAVALNYSIKNIRNNVWQIIIIILYEKSRFNSLMWGLLTLAQLCC